MHEIVTINGSSRPDFNQILPKGSLSTIYSVFIKYLPCSIVGFCSQVHRATLAESYIKEGHFIPGENGGPDSKHNHLAC